MSPSRLILAPALLAVLTAALTPQAASPPPPVVTISALLVQPAPLVAAIMPPQEELFIFAQVSYNGDSDVLHLNPGYFRLRDRSGVLQPPIPYAGVNPLLSQELVGPAHTQGWLLFALPITDTTNLMLVYEQAHSGNIPAQLPRTLPFTPQPSAPRAYATAAQAALDGYLVDEALAAGYLELNINPGQTGAALALTSADRAYLRRQLTRLAADHAAFDHSAPGDKVVKALKAQADHAFTAIEHDLAGLDSVHSAAQWAPWRAAFIGDDHALVDLYQAWPGAQPVPLSNTQGA